MFTQYLAGFAPTGDLSLDAPALLRRHGKDGVADHIIRVAEQARRIARMEQIDETPALQAAWLHDISLVMPYADMAAAADALGLAVLPEERQAPALLHGKLSAWLAENHFGVTDPATLDAMRCHTTLWGAPSLLDKVLFAADKLSWDPADAPYKPAMEAALQQSLDEAIRCFLAHAWARREQMPVVHPWLVEACRYFALHM